MSGEYGGHANHTEVRQVVLELVRQRELRCDSIHIAQFAYEAIYGGGLPTCARLDCGFYLRLTYEELAEKCRLSSLAPDVETSLRNLEYPCPNPEGFEGEGLQLPEPFVQRGA